MTQSVPSPHKPKVYESCVSDKQRNSGHIYTGTYIRENLCDNVAENKYKSFGNFTKYQYTNRFMQWAEVPKMTSSYHTQNQFPLMKVEENGNYPKNYTCFDFK